MACVCCAHITRGCLNTDQVSLWYLHPDRSGKTLSVFYWLRSLMMDMTNTLPLIPVKHVVGKFDGNNRWNSHLQLVFHKLFMITKFSSFVCCKYVNGEIISCFPRSNHPTKLRRCIITFVKFTVSNGGFAIGSSKDKRWLHNAIPSLEQRGCQQQLSIMTAWKNDLHYVKRWNKVSASFVFSLRPAHEIYNLK